MCIISFSLFLGGVVANVSQGKGCRPKEKWIELS